MFEDPGPERRVGLPFTLTSCPACERETVIRILQAGPQVFYRCTICDHIWSHPLRRQND